MLDKKLMTAILSTGLLGTVASANSVKENAQAKGGIKRYSAESEQGRRMTSAKGSVLAGSNHNTTEQEQWNEEVKRKKEARRTASKEHEFV